MVFTFAELLRGYRNRAGIDQAELAANLRIHRNTISGWERGDYLPRERDIVIAMACELYLDPTEIDTLLDAAGFTEEHRTSDRLGAPHMETGEDQALEIP